MTSTQAKDVNVKGYTKKDGTLVDAYTKKVKDKTTPEAKAEAKKAVASIKAAPAMKTTK